MTDPLTREEIARQVVLQALRQVVDPEVGVNVVDLGLIYGVEANARQVVVRLTLTSPACPMGAQLIEEAREAVRAQVPPEVTLDFQLEWEPPWGPERMSEAAKQRLGWQ